MRSDIKWEKWDSMLKNKQTKKQQKRRCQHSFWELVSMWPKSGSVVHKWSETVHCLLSSMPSVVPFHCMGTPPVLVPRVSAHTASLCKILLHQSRQIHNKMKEMLPPRSSGVACRQCHVWQLSSLWIKGATLGHSQLSICQSLNFMILAFGPLQISTE